MFSQVSVCPWRGVPGQVHPLLGRYTPSWAGTPPGQVPPGQVYPLVGTPPLPQFMLGYGQQAGGLHPTGMLSC